MQWSSTSSGELERRAHRGCDASMSSSESTRAQPTVGLDIGGTKVLGVLLDADGNVVKEQRQLSPHAGVDALVATAAAIVEQLAEPGIPVGVGAAGLVNHEGHVLYSPNFADGAGRAAQ